MSDHLDERVFSGLKNAIRKADKAYQNKLNSYTYTFPVILIDFNEWEVYYFNDEFEAQDHVSKVCNEWDDEPPSDEQEEMVILKFISQNRKIKFPHTYKDARLHKEINGEKIYIVKSLVRCEPDLTINVYI